MSSNHRPSCTTGEMTLYVCLWTIIVTFSGLVDSKELKTSNLAAASILGSEQAIPKAGPQERTSEYSILNTLKDVEYARKHAPDGQYYSLATETYEPCNLTCQQGTSLKGSCPMDCRAYYKNEKLRVLEENNVKLEDRVVKLEKKNELHKQFRSNITKELDEARNEIYIQRVLLLCTITVIVALFVLIPTVGKPMIIKFIKQQNIQECKCGPNCKCNAAILIVDKPVGDRDGQNQALLRSDNGRAFQT